MCLALPGKLLDRKVDTTGMPFGTVQFGTVTREVCLACTPDVQPGQYVIVHVGFAIQVLDEAAAEETLALLAQTQQE